MKITKIAQKTALHAKESVFALLLRSHCFLAVFCVSVSGHSVGSFQGLGDIGLQIIRSVSSLSLPPFYSAGAICIKIEVDDIPFSLTRLSFLVGHNLGSHTHVRALEKVSSHHVNEPV